VLAADQVAALVAVALFKRDMLQLRTPLGAERLPMHVLERR
jgi:hypothetical protein